MATQLDLELAALRERRPRRSLKAWFRRRWPFDRRSIRDPGSRDAYWINVQRRLAESDSATLLRYSVNERPPRPAERLPADHGWIG